MPTTTRVHHAHSMLLVTTACFFGLGCTSDAPRQARRMRTDSAAAVARGAAVFGEMVGAGLNVVPMCFSRLPDGFLITYTYESSSETGGGAADLFVADPGTIHPVGVASDGIARLFSLEFDTAVISVSTDDVLGRPPTVDLAARLPALQAITLARKAIAPRTGDSTQSVTLHCVRSTAGGYMIELVPSGATVADRQDGQLGGWLVHVSPSGTARVVARF